MLQSEKLNKTDDDISSSIAHSLMNQDNQDFHKSPTDDDSCFTHAVNLKSFNFDDDGYVIVYTDGSCLGNGLDNPSAGLGVYFGKNNSL